MGTSAGPSLQGIGRGGASNLVLEMDAHDAKSYPGEPTTNVINTLMTGWTNDNGCTVTATGETFQGMPVYSVLFPDGSLPRTHTNFTYTSGSDFTMHVWYRYVSGETGTYMPQPYITAADWSATFATGSFPVTKEWTQMTPLTGTSGGTVTAMFNLYRSNSGSSTDVVMEFAMPQMEEKSYATPFVREGKGGTGTYNARPASANLMIHGNVGTGTTFEDSSPSKLTVTSNNSVGHGGSSKFGGTAIGKFTRGSSQYLTTSSTDVADFGTGDWTIDFWFNITNGSTDRMHAFNVGGGSTANLNFDFNDSYALWVYWNSSGSNYVRFGSDGDYGDDTWHHCAATRKDGMVRVWIDGVHKGSNDYNSSTSMGQTAVLYVGSSAGSQFWDGYLDEVRVCKGTALWVGSDNFTPPTRRNLSAPVVDRSGNDNGGNFATTAMTDTTTYRVGEVIRPIDSALWDFDGTDDKISANSKPITPVSMWTVSAWIYLPDTSGYEWIFSQFSNTYTIGDFGVLTQDSNLKVFEWRKNSNTANNDIIWTSSGGISSLTWQHIAVSRTGTGISNVDDLKMYINGELVKEGGGVTTSSFGTSSVFGYAIGFTDGDYALMKISNLQVYDTPITDQQVKENFNQQRSRFDI